MNATYQVLFAVGLVIHKILLMSCFRITHLSATLDRCCSKIKSFQCLQQLVDKYLYIRLVLTEF